MNCKTTFAPTLYFTDSSPYTWEGLESGERWGWVLELYKTMESIGATLWSPSSALEQKPSRPEEATSFLNHFANFEKNDSYNVCSYSFETDLSALSKGTCSTISEDASVITGTSRALLSNK